MHWASSNALQYSWNWVIRKKSFFCGNKISLLSEISGIHWWWRIGTGTEVSISSLHLSLLMAQIPSPSLHSPLKLGKLTALISKHSLSVLKEGDNWDWDFIVEESKSDKVPIHHVAKPAGRIPVHRERTMKNVTMHRVWIRGERRGHKEWGYSWNILGPFMK